jgi:hypothetical protein
MFIPVLTSSRMEHIHLPASPHLQIQMFGDSFSTTIKIDDPLIVFEEFTIRNH